MALSLSARIGKTSSSFVCAKTSAQQVPASAIKAMRLELTRACQLTTSSQRTACQQIQSRARAAAAHLALMKTDSARMSPSRGRSKLGGSFASQNTAALPFPIAAAKATCSGSQVSRFADRTLDRCTPMDLQTVWGMVR